MKPAALALAALALSLAGCTSNSDPTVPGENFSPGAVQFNGVNATGCSGSKTSLLVPIDHIRSKMPDGFVPVQAIPGFVGVIVESWRCRNTSLAGIDQGQGDWLFVYVYVQPPKNGPADGVASKIMFEGAFSNEALRRSLEPAGFSLKSIELAVDRTVLPAAYDLQRVSVAVEGKEQYSWENSNSKLNQDELERSRTFLAAQPVIFWDSETRSTISGSAGPAAFRAQPGTPGAEVIPSMATGGLAVSIHDLSAVILPPGSHVE